MVPTVQAMLVFLVFDCLQNMYGRYRVLQAIKIWRQGATASLMYVCVCGERRYTGHKASTQDGWFQEGRRGMYLAAVGVCSFVTSITQEQERLSVCTVTLLAELGEGGGGEGRRREEREGGEGGRGERKGDECTEQLISNKLVPYFPSLPLWWPTSPRQYICPTHSHTQPADSQRSH